MFVLEDEVHAEWQGQFATLQEAMDEVTRRASIPWDQPPNVAPCENWRTCGRKYVLIEFNDTAEPWTEIQRFYAFEVDAKGIRWIEASPS